ncbi:MAG: hypothetical protein WCX95_04340 [Candidatus Gracilibacteria bacterium]|jgi:cytoskeletal protein CcmA (bactofilin family)
MKKLISIIFVSLICGISLSMPAFAIEFGASENMVVDTPMNDDFYVAGGRVEINADVNGDLFIAGGDVTVNGNVLGDLMVAGGKVTVKGNVSDDLRMFGGQGAIYGSVGDDVIVGGGQLDIAKTSIIGGSLITGSGYLTIDGEVKGDVRGGVGMLIVNGKIGGSLIVTIEEKLDISKTALINGDVKYSALIDMNVPTASVKGMIHFNKFDNQEALKEVTNAYLSYRLMSYLSALLFVLIMIWLTPNALIKAAENTKKDILKTFGIGVVTMIAGFVGAILLMVTIIGIPLGLMIFAALFMAAYVAKIFVAAWVASYVINFKKPAAKHFKVKLFFGIAGAMLIYYLIGLIPLVGWLVDIILFLIGIGSMAIVKKEGLTFLKAKKII